MPTTLGTVLCCILVCNIALAQMPEIDLPQGHGVSKQTLYYYPNYDKQSKKLGVVKTFDKKGRLLVEEVYNDAGVLSFVHTYDYNDDGSVRKYVRTWKPKKRVDSTIYSYNDQGLEVHRKEFKYNGKTEEATTDYDSFGNKIKAVRRFDDGPNASRPISERETEWKYDYYDGRKINMYLKRQEKFVKLYTYGYDHEGHLVEQTLFIQDTIENKVEKFDTTGKKLAEYRYNKTGNGNEFRTDSTINTYNEGGLEVHRLTTSFSYKQKVTIERTHEMSYTGDGLIKEVKQFGKWGTAERTLGDRRVYEYTFW